MKHKHTLENCLERINLCGPNRNSCSKTDHDATMMHMKEDYYMKSGVFQDRSDQTTLMKFLDNYRSLYNKHPHVLVADAGYGSYDNYFYCVEHGIEAYVKYTMYSKEKEKSYQKQSYNKANWKKNKQGQYICPKGYTFRCIKESVDKRSRYYRINQQHSCGKCSTCEQKSMCTKAKGDRIIHVNPNRVFQMIEIHLFRYSPLSFNI